MHWEDPETGFQFLIGTLKTYIIGEDGVDKNLVFQFLIGTLKTCCPDFF